MGNELKYTLNTSKEKYALQKCKQLDNRPLVVKLYDYGQSYNLSNTTVELRAYKPDGTFVIQSDNITISGNTITVNPINVDIVRIAGVVKLELRLIKSGQSVSSFTFELVVLPSAIPDGTPESKNLVTVIEELNATITNGNIALAQVTSAIDNINNIITSGGAVRVTDYNADKTNFNTTLATKANTSDVSSLQVSKADKSYVETITQSLASGSPKGTFDTLAQLKITYPNGNDNIYLTSDNGNWNYWDTTLPTPAWTSGGVYQEKRLASNSVNIENTKFVHYGKNLFNMNTAISDYHINTFTGEAEQNLGSTMSEYIYVAPNTMYSISNMQQVAFFTVDKIFISGINQQPSPTNFTTPSNCNYIRLNIANVDVGITQLELGQYVTPYENFIIKLPYLDLYLKQEENDFVFNNLTDFGYNKNYHFNGISDTSSTDVFTIEFIVDLQSYSASSGNNVQILFDCFTNNTNISDVYASLFLNNTPTAHIYGGGTSIDGYKINVTTNEIASYNSPLGTYDSSYRYAHIYLRCTTISQVLTEIYYGDIKLKIDNIEVNSNDFIYYGLHNTQAGAILNNDVFPILNVVSKAELKNEISNITTSNRFFGKKLAILGDSISDETNAYATKRYWRIIQEKLNMIVVSTKGISGSTISATTNGSNPMCNRYADLDDNADLVIIFGGTNDWGFSGVTKGAMFQSDGSTPNKDTTTMYGAVNTLLEGLINKYANKDATIMFMTPIPRAENPQQLGGNGSDMTLKDIAKVEIESANYYSIPVLDMHSKSRLPLFITSIKDKFSVDGLHPNDLGHFIMSETVLGFLNTI